MRFAFDSRILRGSANVAASALPAVRWNKGQGGRRRKRPEGNKRHDNYWERQAGRVDGCLSWTFLVERLLGSCEFQQRCCQTEKFGAIGSHVVGGFGTIGMAFGHCQCTSWCTRGLRLSVRWTMAVGSPSTSLAVDDHLAVAHAWRAVSRWRETGNAAKDLPGFHVGFRLCFCLHQFTRDQSSTENGENNVFVFLKICWFYVVCLIVTVDILHGNVLGEQFARRRVGGGHQ